jgi:hypothetical protein
MSKKMDSKNLNTTKTMDENVHNKWWKMDGVQKYMYHIFIVNNNTWPENEETMVAQKTKANDSTTRVPQLALDTNLHWTCCTCLMSIVNGLWICVYGPIYSHLLDCRCMGCCYLILHFLFQVVLCDQIVTQLILWFSKNNIILVNMSPNQQFLNKLQMLKLVKLKVGKALSLLLLSSCELLMHQDWH